MTGYPARLLKPVLVVAGLVPGCAHGPQQNPSPSPPLPAPTTVVPAREQAVTVEQMLEGRIPGLTVTRAPGGGISVQIRGPSSFFMSNEPLILVDDVAVEPGPRGTLSWLQPEEIASIAVLKDEAAAIYGVRGSNGVILIRTKRAQ